MRHGCLKPPAGAWDCSHGWSGIGVADTSATRGYETQQRACPDGAEERLFCSYDRHSPGNASSAPFGADLERIPIPRVALNRLRRICSTRGYRPRPRRGRRRRNRTLSWQKSQERDQRPWLLHLQNLSNCGRYTRASLAGLRTTDHNQFSTLNSQHSTIPLQTHSFFAP